MFKVGDVIIDLDYLPTDNKREFRVVELTDKRNMRVVFNLPEQFNSYLRYQNDTSLVLKSVYESEIYKLLHKED